MKAVHIDLWQLQAINQGCMLCKSKADVPDAMADVSETGTGPVMSMEVQYWACVRGSGLKRTLKAAKRCWKRSSSVLKREGSVPR